MLSFLLVVLIIELGVVVVRRNLRKIKVVLSMIMRLVGSWLIEPNFIFDSS